MVVIFFFNDTATTEIYTLSLHDALPIWPAALPGGAQPDTGVRLRHGPPARPVEGGAPAVAGRGAGRGGGGRAAPGRGAGGGRDRKSTRLNSSHANISYAVFCLKKKKTKQ